MADRWRLSVQNRSSPGGTALVGDHVHVIGLDLQPDEVLRINSQGTRSQLSAGNPVSTGYQELFVDPSFIVLTR